MDNTVGTTSLQGTKLFVDHHEFIQHEDVLRESMNRRAHVESDIVDQRAIRDTAIAAITKLETRLANVTEAENNAARNQAVSAAKFEEQVATTRATRNFGMVMLRLYLQKHNFGGQQIQQTGGGYRCITKRLFEITADSLWYPRKHTRGECIERIGVHLRDLTIAPALAMLTRLNVLRQRRALTGNGFSYGLYPTFIDKVLQ